MLGYLQRQRLQKRMRRVQPRAARIPVPGVLWGCAPWRQGKQAGVHEGNNAGLRRND
jgi:hypothetical protein